MIDREWARRMAALIRQPAFVVTVTVTIVALIVGGLAWSAGHDPATATASGSPTAPHPSTSPGSATDDPWASLEPSTSLPPAPVEAGVASAILTAPAAAGPIVPTDVTFQLASVDTTPASVLASRLTVDPAVAMTVQPDAADRTASLTPAEPLVPGAVYRFTLRGASGELLDSWAFQAKQPLRIVGTLPEADSSDVPVDTGIELTFDQDGTLDVASHVTILPATPGRSEQHGRTWVFIPTKPLSRATIYSIVVSPGVTLSGSDESTVVETRFRFETAAKTAAPAGSEIVFQDLHVESATRERPVIGLWTYTEDDTKPIESVRLDVFGLKDMAAAVDAFRTIRARPTWAQWSTEGIVDTSKLHRVVSANLRLQPYQGASWVRLPNRLPAGWYLVQDRDDHPTQTILQVTDLAGYVSVSVDKTIVWANDLVHGGAVKGAVAMADEATIGRTDDEGLATGETPKALLPSDDEPCTATCDPVVTVVAPDGRAVFLPASGSYDKFESYGGAYYYSQGNTQYWNVFHTDRNIYAPGDTANVWGVVRDRATGRVPATVTVTYTPNTWDDTRRPAAATLTLHPGPAGAFAGSRSLAGLEDGDYDVSLSVDGTIVASSWMAVHPIAKPAYALEVTTGRRIYVVGDRIKVSVGARFFEGTPLPGVPVRIVYDDAGDSIERVVTTDAGGSAVYRTTARASRNQEGPEEVVFTAVPARAEEGEIVSADHETFVFPSRRTIDVTPRIAGGRVRVTGSVHVLDIDRLEAQAAAGVMPWEVDARGAPVGGATVTLRFIELIPTHHQVGTEYDFIEKKVVPVYDDGLTERAAGTVRTRTNATGAYTASIPATTKDHDYRVIASVSDPDGLVVRETVDAARHPWPADEQSFPSLRSTTPATAGEDGYSIGDRVDVTMVDPDTKQATGDGTRYLFYVLAGGVHATKVQSSPRFSTTFGTWALPNLEIAAVRFTGHEYVGTVVYGAAFRASDRRLQIDLTPDAARYVPGARVTVGIRTRDASGSPVAATVILRTIDEKLYTIGAASEDDPLAELYTPLGSGLVSTSKSHTHPRSELGGGDTTGGGEGGDARTDFRDSLLFTSVTTGADGRGSVSFPLSDDLTSWRVTAAAFTAALDAGSTSISIPVGLPFFVDAPVAREYLTTDRPSIPVRVYGSAVTAADAVTVRVTAASLLFDSGPIRTHAFTTVAVPLPALALGPQTVTIRATSGSGSALRQDSVVRTFAVVDTRLTTSRTAYVELPATGPFAGGPGRTHVVISDASSGRYLALLTDIAAGGGARLDRGLAADVAQTLLATSYGPDAVDATPGGTFDASRYQTEDGGLALLPYSGSDLELSVMVALLAPRKIGRLQLSGYLHAIRDDAGETSERRTFALAGLAGLGEPVIGAVRAAAADPSLTDRERLMLGLGAAALGDDVTARAIAASLVTDRGERLGEQARLRVGSSAADITEATAQMAVLAASIGDANAPLYWAYVDENPARDRLEVLTAVAYISRTLDRLPVTPAAFAYTLDGTRTTIELKPGETYALSLTAAQLATLKVEPTHGTLGVTTSWQAPITPAQVKPDPDATITREVKPLTVDSKDLVIVTLRVTFGPQAASGCHQVTELVPSGLAPVGAMATWPDPDAGEGGGAAYVLPYDQSGQRVFFCAEPVRARPAIKLRYVARVVTPGTYTWEPAIAESRSQEDHASLTSATTIVIH